VRSLIAVLMCVCAWPLSKGSGHRWLERRIALLEQRMPEHGEWPKQVESCGEPLSARCLKLGTMEPMWLRWTSASGHAGNTRLASEMIGHGRSEIRSEVLPNEDVRRLGSTTRTCLFTSQMGPDALTNRREW
jgi:hypothetical protein